MCVGGTVSVAEPAVVKKILMQPEHTEVRHPVYNLLGRLSSPASYGVLNMDSDSTWKNHTRAMIPVFHASNVAKFAGDMHATSLRHAEALLAAGGGDNLVETMRHVSFDVLSSWGFGQDPAQPEMEALHTALKAEGQYVHDGTIMEPGSPLTLGIHAMLRSRKYPAM